MGARVMLTLLAVGARCRKWEAATEAVFDTGWLPAARWAVAGGGGCL